MQKRDIFFFFWVVSLLPLPQKPNITDSQLFLVLKLIAFLQTANGVNQGTSGKNRPTDRDI